MKLEECYVGQIIRRKLDLYGHTRYKYQVEIIRGNDVLCRDLSEPESVRRVVLRSIWIDSCEPESDPFTDWAIRVRKEAGIE